MCRFSFERFSFLVSTLQPDMTKRYKTKNIEMRSLPIGGVRKKGVRIGVSSALPFRSRPPFSRPDRRRCSCTSLTVSGAFSPPSPFRPTPSAKHPTNPPDPFRYNPSFCGFGCGLTNRVGDIGPGAFMILEHLKLVPFGPMRPGNQAALGNSLADLHLSKVLLRSSRFRVFLRSRETVNHTEIR